jgi:hypothetical protein
MKCETCKYWQRFINSDRLLLGWCHRYPPTEFDEDMEACYPTTVPFDGWCGEYQEKKE